MVGEDQKFVIWGAGNRGRFLHDYCVKGGIKISAFIDSNPLLQGRTVNDCPVISFEEYLHTVNKAVVIISPLHYDSVVQTLQDAGIERYLFYRDIALLTFDNGAEAANDDVIHAPAGTNGWIVERARLLSSFRDWNLSNLQYFWRKDLMQNEFGSKQPLVSMRDVLDKMRRAQFPLINVNAENVISGTRLLCGFSLHIACGGLPEKNQPFDLLLIHGVRLDMYAHCLLIEARDRDVPVVFEEDGFLRSIVPFDCFDEEDRFRRPHALTFQEHGVYFNAMQPSYMEILLESDWQLTEEEEARARRCIARIRQERLSKYNHQPLSCPFFGEHNKKKVLVIDQVYGDKSIEYGFASDDTFAEMLEAALRENPTAEIYVKTHPASDKGHFGQIQTEGRIHLLCEPINPIALLERMDKVYACVSTMGFEALLCGCETHVFGMPFYAGWGLTVDKLTCPRRTKRRSLEEVFYVSYILSSVYVSYETGVQCEIEQAMDELVALRQQYFQEKE